MKDTKNQKLQNFLYLVKREKLQNFGLNPKKPKRFFFREEKEGFVVFDSLMCDIFFMNETAKEILFLFDSGLSKKIIKKYISKKYKISFEKALGGINKILGAIK